MEEKGQELKRNGNVQNKDIKYNCKPNLLQKHVQHCSHKPFLNITVYYKQVGGNKLLILDLDLNLIILSQTQILSYTPYAKPKLDLTNLILYLDLVLLTLSQTQIRSSKPYLRPGLVT